RRGCAGAAGGHCGRPGAGPAGALPRRRFGSPGRVLASAAPGASAAGALGMLALPACALECAAAMAGEPLLVPRPRVAGVEITGVPDPGVAGIDVLAAGGRRPAGGGEGGLAEFPRPGVVRAAVAARAPVPRPAGPARGARS